MTQAPAGADKPADAPAGDGKTPASQEPAVPESAPPEQGVQEGSIGLHIIGFADVNFHTSSEKGVNSSFRLGQLDLFVTSRLSDELSVLDENVIEADNRNAFGIEVERLLLYYSINEYLTLAFGRYHTAIGYYSTAYHHGTWLQTAIGRPFLFAFEDGGGILPIHNVGVTASGRIPSGPLGLKYTVEIGNGRTSRSPADEPVQNVVDENNGKALNVAITSRPDALPGLQVGVSLYHDTLTPAGSVTIEQFIPVVHAVYETPTFEWLNEALVVRHSPMGAGKTFSTPGFYTQVSREFGKFRPYFRYQYVNAPDTEPVFADVGLRHGPSLGLRYNVGASAAFKIQYDHTERRVLTSTNELTLQSSFTF